MLTCSEVLAFGALQSVTFVRMQAKASTFCGRMAQSLWSRRHLQSARAVQQNLESENRLQDTQLVISLCRLFQSVMNEEALLGFALRMSQDCKAGSESAVTRPQLSCTSRGASRWQAATANSCASKDAQVAEARSRGCLSL